MLEVTSVCVGETISSFGIPDDRADDLDQLMREVFKVKICERIGFDFLDSRGVLCTGKWHGTLKVSPRRTIRNTHWQWLTGSVSTARSNSSQTKWKVSVAYLVRKLWVQVCVTVRTLWINKKDINTDHWLAQHCTLDKTHRSETQYATKEAARFMSDPTRAAKCMLKRLCKYYSEAPVLSWSFPYQEMPNEIRAVTDANWAGELEGLCSTSCGWIYFGDHLLETCSSTQQIVALSTAESEYISITKGAAHALEVRSAMVEYGMTFNVVCETDAWAGRAMATRRGVGRVRHFDARLLWLQQLCAEGVVEVRARLGEHNEADLGTKMVDLRRMTSLLKGTPFRPLMGWSSWMVATTLTAVAQAAKDCRVLIWNVRNMCETSGWFWICV